jgi:major membrane immunogen (membrane-anchored lipoprotein)
MKRNTGICALLAAIVLASVLSGCGGSDAAESYTDGVYTGVSSEDDMGAYGEVSIMIEGGAVAACTFVTWQKDGTVKGEDYGKVNGEISNQDYYDKAQLAVRAMKQYADAFAELGDVNEVDAVSGATNSHGQFLEAVADALDKAK